MGEAKRKMQRLATDSYMAGATNMANSLKSAFEAAEYENPGAAVSLIEVVRVIDDAILMVEQQRGAAH